MNTTIEKIGMGTKPDPFNYTIESWGENEHGTLIEVKYHGCKTFDGIKILLVKGLGINTIKKRKTLDPHFFEDHPIMARFAPTKEGRKLAKICLNNLCNIT